LLAQTLSLAIYLNQTTWVNIKTFFMPLNYILFDHIFDIDLNVMLENLLVIDVEDGCALLPKKP
jgi:hypothetical protein